jgi:hypothetical protein
MAIRSFYRRAAILRAWRGSTPERRSLLLAIFIAIGLSGVLVAALAAVVVVEKLLLGPGGPVARFYRSTDIADVFEIVSDGFAWL